MCVGVCGYALSLIRHSWYMILRVSVLARRRRSLVSPTETRNPSAIAENTKSRHARVNSEIPLPLSRLARNLRCTMTRSFVVDHDTSSWDVVDEHSLDAAIGYAPSITSDSPSPSLVPSSYNRSNRPRSTDAPGFRGICAPCEIHFKDETPWTFCFLDTSETLISSRIETSCA